MARKRGWTPEEDKIVGETMDLPLATVAGRLPGRTAKSVVYRRMVLQGTRLPIVTQTPTVGRGRAAWLIAKTCVECGRFLPAAEYLVRSRGGWTHTCKTCRVKITRRYTDRDLAETRQTAVHHAQPWTSKDLNVALARRSDGRWLYSARIAAEMVGRTSSAVQRARSAYRNAPPTPPTASRNSHG